MTLKKIASKETPTILRGKARAKCRGALKGDERLHTSRSLVKEGRPFDGPFKLDLNLWDGVLTGDEHRCAI